jgi:hypothetical protein
MDGLAYVAANPLPFGSKTIWLRMFKQHFAFRGGLGICSSEPNSICARTKNNMAKDLQAAFWLHRMQTEISVSHK